jgi:hypothetical protein
MNEIHDPKKEREIQQNIHRVATNLLVLLDIGLFPGKHSVGLSEAKEFVASIQADALARQQQIIPPPVSVPAVTH